MAKAKSGTADGTGSSRELVVSGYRGQPQKRSGRKTDWTQAKRDKFIQVLADSCNVSLAARTVKRSIGNVYKQRTLDADFRMQWDQALATGYARLEMMMLERALHGVEKIIVLKSGETTVMREYPDRVALSLLRLHRDNVATTNDGVDEQDYQEACERIIARLERLRERDADDDAERAVETKQAVDRLALVLWGLRHPQGKVRRGHEARPGPGVRRAAF